MCYNHIKEEQSKTTREQSRDPDYEPQKVIISSPVLNTSVEFSKGLVNCLDESSLLKKEGGGCK